MVKVTVVIREYGGIKPDYSLSFELPEVPAIGSYISIHRPDMLDPYGEDVLVRQIWWRLEHPETAGHGSSPEKIGSLKEVFVECDKALGPYSSDEWRKGIKGAKEQGVQVPEFDVSRFSIRQNKLKT